MHLQQLILTCFGLAQLVAAVPSIVRKGRYLYTSDTNARFTIRGLAYQYPAPIAAASTANGGFPEPDSFFDPLADLTACQRDLSNFVTLGINAIRVYSVNPWADHSGCMNLLNQHGIYVISDLGLPLNGSIDRSAPGWTTNLLDQYITVIDNLAQYPNLLAVSVGNEVVSAPNNTVAGTFVKAAARDIKAYIKSKNYPVLTAYASTDGAQWRQDLAAYLTCGDESTTVDLLGLNSYRWCGDSTYAGSGYQSLSTEFATYPVPTYFSEYGCITQTRTWSDVPVMFSTPMSDVWSGGIAFEYFADTLGYGMTNNMTGQDAPVVTNNDFAALAHRYTSVTPPTTPSFASAPVPAYPTCAAPDGVNFLASNTLPPTPDQSVCQCLSVFALPCTVYKTTTPAVVGSLLDYTCSLLSQNGMSCDNISASGTSAAYGPLSFCAPSDKLNYIMSMWYQNQGFKPQACSFGNNATINTHAPSDASGVQAAIQSCLANGAGSKSGGVFTPSLLPAAIPSGGSASQVPPNAAGSGAVAQVAVSLFASTMFLVAGAAAVVL